MEDLFLSKRTEADFQAWRDQRDWTARKYALWDAGKKLEHLRGWAVPITAWTGFILLMLFAFLCLNTLMRKQWIDRERLSFPLTALPLDWLSEKVQLVTERVPPSLKTAPPAPAPSSLPSTDP